jgi:peptidyl-prolyl cis-trans isomerase A (cyclophilin A)
MTRWISASLILAGLALAVPVVGAGQTTPPAARRGAPPPAATPAAPTTAKPAAAAPAKPATPAAAQPAVPAVPLPPGTYAHFTTSRGNFTVHLFDKDAPKTVDNFVGLATGRKAWKLPSTGAMVHRPFFNNLTFHRVIPRFMIQGGDPLGDGTGDAGFEFRDEISPKYHHDKPGMMSMANHGPNTNSSQFFITVAPYPSLDGHYSIFGEVVAGLDNVLAISRVTTSGPPNNRPLTPVVMKTVRIEVVK